MTPEQWKKIDGILETALDLPPGKRTAYVEQVCAGDDDLRIEVEALLEAHDNASGFIERPPATEMAELFDSGVQEDFSGQRIGPYMLARELGRGGMGVVYLAARDDDEFRKQVAIKLVGYGPQNAALMRRFRRERQILANLDHPNIARLLDGGKSEHGWPYLVMEYVEGTPINAYCNQRRLSINDRLKLFREVCQAVQYAHQNLIVHRDLKPSNILVTNNGAPKLLDFGIAKLVHTETPAALQSFTTQLATGALMMTPEYASPEQVRGEAITTASDVYSLGVVLYELLTGQPPYLFKDRSLPELVRVVCEEEPEQPSERAGQIGASLRNFGEIKAERLRSQLRGDPDQIVMTALQKDVQLRYRSVEQLSEDIRRHLEGRPILARQASWQYRVGKFVRRYKAGVTLTALLLLTMLSGIVGTLWQWRIANEQVRANRRLAYAGQMHLAAQAWEMANIRQLRELLDNQLPKAGEEDLRGFEWFHLWRLLHQNGERLTLPHIAEVWSVAVSPDGKQLATAHSEDGSTVKLWDLATGKLLSQLTQGNTTTPWVVAFSPDGRRIATGHFAYKDTVTLFDLAAGGKPSVLPGHTKPTRTLVFSPDGKKLFTGSDDETIKAWDADTGKELLSFQNCSVVRTLAVSPDGRWLATQCASELILWDAASGKRLRSLEAGEGSGLWSILFSPDGQGLIVGGKSGEARFYDLKTGLQTRTFVRHNAGIRAMTLSGDGKLLATAGEDRTAKIWELATGREVAALKGHLAEVYGVVFTSDGKTVVTASTDFTAKVWDLEKVSDRSLLAAGARAEALSSDGKQIAVGGSGQLRLLDAATGHEQAVLADSRNKGGGGQTATVAFSPDGKLLATCKGKKEIWLWDCATGRELPPFVTSHKVRSLAFSPDGRRLLTGGEDSTARLWDLDSRQELRAFKNHENTVWVTAFSPDGRKAATGSPDKTVRLWDVETGRELAGFTGQEKPILSLAFSPDGKMLAVGSADNTVKLWDLITGRELRTLTGIAGHVQGLAFSPDGQRLVTGSGDGVIRLWNPFLGQQLIMLRGHSDMVSLVAFTPDGRTLISGGPDLTVRRWVTAATQEVTARQGQ